MKKLYLPLCIFFLFSGTAASQVVIGPGDRVVGGVIKWYWYPFVDNSLYVSGYETTTSFLVGFYTTLATTDYFGTPMTIYPEALFEGVLEFDVSGITPAGVTSANFRRARLDGLSVIYTIGSGPMTVLLYDMLDDDEDGSVTVNDWHSMRGSGTTLFTMVPTMGTTYNNIDVTDALLHDLFGVDQSNYSGFLFYTPPDNFGTMVLFHPETPTLTIFIKKALSAVNHLLLKNVD